MRTRVHRCAWLAATPWACAVLVALAAAPARARPARRMFEPTDLELEDPGLLEIDGQIGVVRGPEAFRLAVPDLEIDLGLPHGFELDLDGAFALEAPADGTLRFDHVAPDNLWLGLKTGLFDWNDPAQRAAWAIGAQIGPKLPLAPEAHGVGIEALLLAGFHRAGTHVMLNAGGLVDPASGDDTARPVGLEGGVDLAQDLADDRWSLTAQLGAIVFRSDDPHQLTVSFGVAWAPSQTLELSLVMLAGLLPGSDRYGLLLGLAPKIAVWR